MWNRLVQTTAPESTPVTVDEAKVHIRVEHDDEDTYIQTLIDAAVGMIDGPDGIGIAMVEQTWEASLDCFPVGAIILPLVPCLTVESITYIDANGDEQTLDDALYQVDVRSKPARILPAVGTSWPATQSGAANAVIIEATFGYVTVPALLRAAILFIVGHLYENREAVVIGTIATEIPLAARDMLNKYAVGRAAA